MKSPVFLKKIVWVCFFWLMGCQSSQHLSHFSVSMSPHFQEYNLQRIFFLPMEGNQNTFSSTLQDSLAKNKAWEVVYFPLPQSCPISPYNIPSSSLSYIAQKYHVQAVALGKVSHFSLTPMKISLRFFLVSVYDGKILYSIDGTWEDQSIYSLEYEKIERSMASLSVEKFFSEVCRQIMEQFKNGSG
ncbi:MAG: hypothetical protein HUU50_20015 [Candidatus Brocadiae bacterium]|nr:hypothetical protein [Candidatus Brocadiia bacterium]